jgi:hypothetical protein
MQSLKEEVMYHGAAHDRDLSLEDHGNRSFGLYFVDDEEAAKTYGPYMHKADVEKGEKNLTVDAQNRWSHKVPKKSIPDKNVVKRVNKEEKSHFDNLIPRRETDTDIINRAAYEEGYDSVTYHNVIDGGNSSLFLDHESNSPAGQALAKWRHKPIENEIAVFDEDLINNEETYMVSEPSFEEYKHYGAIPDPKYQKGNYEKFPIKEGLFERIYNLAKKV